MSQAAFREATENAAWLWAAASALQRQARALLEFAGQLLDDVDDEHLQEAVTLLQTNKVTGRGPLVEEIHRRRKRAETTGPTMRPGQWYLRLRATTEPWPQATAWVYILCDQRGLILYIGMSEKIKKRLDDHSRRGVPWHQAHLLACASRLDALELEGRYIRHHQPPWNIAGKAS